MPQYDLVIEPAGTLATIIRLAGRLNDLERDDTREFRLVAHQLARLIAESWDIKPAVRS
jgi:hypothetical protein